MRTAGRIWTRLIRSARPDTAQSEGFARQGAEELDLEDALDRLPGRLDCSSLPDGVIELVIDDFEKPTRRLLDVRGRQIRTIDPGVAVPWASISGPATAWALALGPACDVAKLVVTGDRHLARSVLAAFPRYP